MELSTKAVFSPFWKYEYKTKGKWVLTNFEEDDDAPSVSKTQDDAEREFEYQFDTKLVDGVLSFSHGKTMETDKFDEDECWEIIVRNNSKSEPIRYLFTNSSSHADAEFMAQFKTRMGTFPLKLGEGF